MPVRNEAAFIERSLRSVLAQDYPNDRFEVLIVDGVSDDPTRSIISRAPGSCRRLIVLDNPDQIVATGLNLALPLTRGEIIVRVDGHCEIAPDYVARCVSHLQRDGI